MVDLEGFFLPWNMANLGGLKQFFFLGQKKFFGAFASPFLFCLQSGKKI